MHRLTNREDGLVTVIGRGNSGTRVLAHTLYASGVFLGATITDSGDTMPPEPMYEASRLVGEQVRWAGGLSWDFSSVLEMPIPSAFVDRVATYLAEILDSPKPHRGWKLPETTLAYPWIARLLPQIKYIHIVRDPRDALLGNHLTDDLRRWGVNCPGAPDVLGQRVESWKYQLDIVKATPRPSNFISLRYEDIVLEYDRAMRRLERFLEMPLARIVVDVTRVDKLQCSAWEQSPRFSPLAPHLRDLGYE